MDMEGNATNLKVGTGTRQILSIALPITLAILIPQLNLLINSIFLGRLSEEALGNAGITGVFFLIFALAGNGLNNALQTVLSKYAGADKPQFFAPIFIQGIRISIVFAFACIAFTWAVAPFIMRAVSTAAAYDSEMNFLRIIVLGLPLLYLFQMGNAVLVSTLNSRLLIIGFVVEALTNILFDWLLIFGNGGFPKLGFNGAAIATILAEVAGLSTVWAVLYYKGLIKQYQLFKSFKYYRDLSREVLQVAIPLVLQYMLSISTWLVFFLLIETMGQQAKAISNTMRNVFGIAGVFAWSLSSTCNVMVSNLLGQQRETEIMSTVTKIATLSFFAALFYCGLLNIFPHWFFSLFSQGDKFTVAATPVVRVISIGILFLSIAVVWLNAVTGTGKTKINLAIEIVAIALYLCYTCFIMLNPNRTLALAWTNEFIYWTSIFLMSYLYMRKGRWRKKFTHISA